MDWKCLLSLYCESSDGGYDMSPDIVKQCQKFEQVSIIDPEFDTTIRDNSKNMHDIDPFVTKDVELYEKLKQQIIDYVNAPDTTLNALIYLTEKLEDYISGKED